LEEASYAIPPISFILPVWELATLSFLLCACQDPALVLTRGQAAEALRHFPPSYGDNAPNGDGGVHIRSVFLSYTTEDGRLRLGRGCADDRSYGCRYRRRNEVVKEDEGMAVG
jgi:hypothetical protein